jgi:hypothetical protein
MLTRAALFSRRTGSALFMRRAGPEIVVPRSVAELKIPEQSELIWDDGRHRAEFCLDDNAPTLTRGKSLRMLLTGFAVFGFVAASSGFFLKGLIGGKPVVCFHFAFF